jgi:Family of unknown function (DUF5996)
MIETWPALPLGEWKDTYATLHMWSQIVGKIRLSKTPLINHFWNSTLYVTPRGLTTLTIPDGSKTFQLDFDFVDHNLIITTSHAGIKTLKLTSRSVADFYAELTRILKSLGIEIALHAKPDEVPDPIPFAEDHVHATYVAEHANRFFRILAQAEMVFQEFRSRFIGKCSPVHFFWGSFDLAVTRFNGKRAPERPGADAMMREAYSHECISAGFWPGSGTITSPHFYAYAAPVPDGLGQERIAPKTARYDQQLGEFLLMYDDVRTVQSPRNALLDFMQSTYEAGAKLAGWDRKALERS